ncbi:hypothetical protein BX600DRAFT_511990 [Xylariales sp. PMI_506]|nr:hypothetical protein BX600DRAFT_511990 [Xylariales sp. PMI_506]
MDDPWGAPWASSDHLSRRDPSPPPPTTFLSPPPKAFIGSATSSPELSLWAVGDETSDWAKSSTTLEQTPSHGWSPWADPEFQANNPSPRFDSRATKHPIAWPTNAAVSPGRKPIHSRSSSTLRQPSPDPWTLEHPWHEDADNGRCASRQSISLDSTLEGYSEPAVSQQAENVEGKDGSAIVAPTSQPTLLADMENGYKTTSISSVRTTKSIDEQVTSSASSRKSNELLTNYTSSSDGGSNKIVEVHASSENTGIAIERSHDLILHPESELELLQDPNHNSRTR